MCKSRGAYLPNVNLFTNGILLGDKDFCNKWLPIWKELGLTNIAVSIHSTEPDEQAQAYGLNKSQYPNFNDVFSNIRTHGLGVRCTLLLSKKYIGESDRYVNSVKDLIYFYDVKNITSWPVGNPDGTKNEYSPSWYGLWTIRRWLNRNAKLCHSHSWSGGVFDYDGNILRLTDYVTKHDPKKNFVRQLVVFQDGLTTYSWIKEGSLCMR